MEGLKMYQDIILLIAAYLIGSIPFGLVIVRLVRGIDVRNFGSNNVGAINVTRVGGLWPGILTLTGDIGKAVLVVIAASMFSSSPEIIASCAMLVLLGHAFSFWLYLIERRFSEGKCVASSLGVLTGLAIIGIVAWWVPVALVGVWITGLLAPKLLTGHWSRISPVTMTVAALIPVFVTISNPESIYIWLSICVAALILLRHKNNIRRLLAGEEPRIGQSTASA